MISWAKHPPKNKYRAHICLSYIIKDFSKWHCDKKGKQSGAIFTSVLETQPLNTDRTRITKKVCCSGSDLPTLKLLVSLKGHQHWQNSVPFPGKYQNSISKNTNNITGIILITKGAQVSFLQGFLIREDITKSHYLSLGLLLPRSLRPERAIGSPTFCCLVFIWWLQEIRTQCPLIIIPVVNQFHS